jgi:hypothetical protein
LSSGARAQLDDTGTQVWSQDSPSIEGGGEAADWFGFDVARGDFNGDGFDDLAIGVANESVGAEATAGSVNVIYGTPTGLSSSGNQLWNQDSGDIEDISEAGDQFGFSVTAGDFNDDGYDDLAIGVRSEDVGGESGAGAVNVIYGSSSGLSANGNQFWTQDTLAGTTAEAGDQFGFSLAAGDFNGDGYDDLAVGADDEDLTTGMGTIEDIGAVNVLYGSAAGLVAAGNQFWNQASTDIAGVEEEGDVFGSSLAAGDFDNDGYDDLAIGVTGEDVTAIGDAGAVNVIYGSAAGLDAAGNQIWHQDISGILGEAEQGDGFGFSLASGDFDGNGFVDLAIGVFSEDIGAIGDAGSINVLYGSSSGLSSTGNQLWDQDSVGIAGVPEEFDGFGNDLAAGFFSNDGYADLAIGVPGEDVGSLMEAGAVNVLYGSIAGLTVDGNQIWDETTSGARAATESNLFGYSVAALDADGDGNANLAVGVLLGDSSVTNDVGSLVVLGDTTVPSITVSMDKAVYSPSETADVFLNIVAGSAVITADVYLVIQVGSDFFFIGDGGATATTDVVPYQAGKVVSADEMIAVYTDVPLAGVPPDTYTWFAGFTEPGTFEVIGDISIYPFTVAPVR